MGIFDHGIKRAHTGEIRQEDFIQFYFPEQDSKVLASGEYLGLKYVITSTGYFPTISIRDELSIDNMSGMREITLHNRNGKECKISRFCHNNAIVFSHDYNKPGDFIFEKNLQKGQPGHKYTIKEVEDDVKAFIQGIKKKNRILDDLHFSATTTCENTPKC